MSALRMFFEARCSARSSLTMYKRQTLEIFDYFYVNKAVISTQSRCMHFSFNSNRRTSIVRPSSHVNKIYSHEKYIQFRQSISLRQDIKHTRIFQRLFSSINNPLHQMRKANDKRQDLVEAADHHGQLTVGQKVKQAGKDASYMGVLLVGFGITGILVWYVLSELIFSFSPNSVYSKALDIVKQDASVMHAVGEPIKGYGEETSRGRRRHVSHQEYIVDGVNYMRVKFYIAGSKHKGTVHVDAKETSRGRFEFRYIFVELEGFPETIVVKDNR